MLVDYSAQTADPIAEFSRFYAPPWKLGVMAMLRPAFHWEGDEEHPSLHPRSMPRRDQHGYPLKARRQWVDKKTPLRGNNFDSRNRLRVGCPIVAAVSS